MIKLGLVKIGREKQWCIDGVKSLVVGIRIASLGGWELK